ncbi:MAG TPA: 2-hydroxychromene-2-carboxylate isomerase [Noviherbaspirillum sp.]|jgi:2-hydroxychromene-2-carboxylate isomerase|uniref:2-hydroxychromene-2-carboxylate isomerase n=1 Tax=Noviherbaspirillum sp. TaxID=1926288 RepID=UPI002F952B39
MGKLCQYFFSPQSPWTYLGHARLGAIARQHGARIEMKPCDLGKVFDVSGGVPLAKRPPQRQAYRLVELRRWSEFLDIPLTLQPKYFPVAGEPAARLIIAAEAAYGHDAAFELAGAVMRALWAEERNIADAATLAAIAGNQGLDGQRLLDEAGSPAAGTTYERNTTEAVAANVFGSPWYVLDGEPYWGQDRLDFLERALSR